MELSFALLMSLLHQEKHRGQAYHALSAFPMVK
jgi:hypothetical protein